MEKPSTDMEEFDLESRWIEAQNECRKIMNLSSQDLLVLTVEDVVGQINSKLLGDRENGARYRKAKDVFNNILTSFQNLGGLVADGASMVFGPSNLCFNALSYLIGTVQNYRKIFTGLTDLFERISAFLMRFQVYSRAKSLHVLLDIRLRSIICDLLASFMRICALSYKISQQNKALLYLEVLSFSSDKGIQAELSTLETLVARETGMSVALILEQANIVDGKITAVSSSLKVLTVKTDGIADALERHEMVEKNKEADGMIKKNREIIMNALKIKDDEPWRVELDKHIKDRVQDTGHWLLLDSQFSEWTNLTQSVVKSTFGLEAKQGFGKSYLCSSVIQHLKRLYPGGSQDPPVSVAYHFFQKDPKDANTVNKGLRYILWQLTQNNLVYQKLVAGTCDRSEDFSETVKLWQHLICNLSKVDATFFVILDGIDEAEKEQGRTPVQIIREVIKLSKPLGKLCVKFFLTGRPKVFEELTENNDVSMTRMRLEAQNGDDIVKYIDAKMDEMDILKKVDQPAIQALRTQIRDDLTKGVQGDFVKLDYKLAEIRTKRRQTEIEEVLKYAGEDRQDAIAREIKRLNTVLGQEDIQDLNELLVWAIGAREWMTLEQAEAILFLKHNEKSLIPLEEQIEKYSAFLDVSTENDYSTIMLKFDSISEYFEKKSEEYINDQASSATASLHESEIAIVKRFLKSVCDDQLFQKFGFEEFFERKLGKNIARVGDGLGQDAIILRITSTCIGAMLSDRDDVVAPLHHYAFLYFPDHLGDVDLALTDPQEKSRIGTQLIKLFLDEKFINKWWTEDRIYFKQYWIYEIEEDVDCIGIVLTWLKDSAVLKKLTDSERAWVNGLASNLKPEEDLLKPTAVVLAKRWLQTEQDTPKEVFWWLLGFVTKINNRIEKTERVKDDIQPTAKQITNIESWAQIELHVAEKNSLWAAQMAITFSIFGFYDEAINRCLIALDLDKSNWRASFCLSKAYSRKGDRNLAVETMTKLVDRFRVNHTLLEELREFYYDTLLRMLGEWNLVLGNEDAATEIYREMLTENPKKYSYVYLVMRVLRQQGKFSEIIELLKNMAIQDTEQEPTRLVAAYHELASHEPFQLAVINAAEQSSSLEFVKQAYRKAIEAAKGGTLQLGSLASLRYWYGLTMYHYSETENELEEALETWEHNAELVGVGVANSELSHACLHSIRRLASAYLQLARIAGLKSAAAKSYLQRLEKISDTTKGDWDMMRNDTKLLVGRLYHLIGEEFLADECVKGHVRVALDLLSDDDPLNDWQGYYKLAITLMHLRKDVDALAAWSLIGPTNEREADREASQGQDNYESHNIAEVSVAAEGEIGVEAEQQKGDVAGKGSGEVETGIENSEGDEEEDEEESEGEEKGDDGQKEEVEAEGFLIRCDGRCAKLWTFADDIYYCRDCLDVKFDQDCLEKLQTGTLARKICHPNHEFFQVPIWDVEGNAKIPKGHVKVGEQILEVKDWLNSVQRKFGLDTHSEN